MALQGTKMAVHSPFTHADARDWEVIRAWQPRSLKAFDDTYASTDRMNWVYSNLPNTLITMRDHPLSEQKEDMYNNPVATGQRHAQEWKAWRDNGKFGKEAWKDIEHFDPARTIVLGVNEPSSMEDHPLERSNPNYAVNVRKVVDYTVAFLDTLKSFGMRGGALNLSVGFPDNTGTNTRPEWELWELVRQAIVRGNHFLFLHEYWDINGVGAWMQWWFDRLGMCPWDVPIIVGETGVDRGVNWQWKPGDSPRGYGGNLNAEQYIAQLQIADMRYKGDRRVHSAQIYTYDYDNPIWASFSLRDMREQWLRYVNTVRNVQDTNALIFPRYPLGIANPLPPTGGQVPPPNPNPTPDPIRWDKVCWAMEQSARTLKNEGYITSHDWILNCVSYREAKARRDGTLPPEPALKVVNLPSNHFSSRQGQRAKYGIIHTTASPVGSSVANTANYLKQNDRGVSIHEFVSKDIVYVMVPDDKAAHHCESETAKLPNTPNNLNNEVSWGIEAYQIAGRDISPDVAEALFERVVKKAEELDIPSGNWLGHYEIDPTRRQDPVGINMIDFRKKLKEALGE